MFSQQCTQRQQATNRQPAARNTRRAARTLRSGALWVAVAALASTGACTSLPMAESGFAAARYSTLAPLASAPTAPRIENVALPTARRSNSLYAPNIAIGDSLLAATVTRLRRMSPSFDSAITAIEQSGIPVVIGTESQLRSQLPPGYGYVNGWQALTAVYPLTPNGARGKPIDHFAVIVRMGDLRAALAASTTHADSSLFNRYVERVLAHEIYGHLLPQLELGKTAPIACDDPTSGADWYSACVMQRERRVMAQLVTARGTYATLGTH
ncbi:MAG: hypothetical protein KGL93_13120 [Gemmatimonadota bacterium]|nr:hypothetical protein [Gemmatimonadota bacterium]